MSTHFSLPPNWPPAPPGWQPPPGWEPDPAWGPAPYGWQFWQIDGPPADLRRRGPVHYGLLGLAVLVCFGGGILLVRLGKAAGVDDAVAALGYAPVTLTLKLHKWLISRARRESTAEVAVGSGYSYAWPVMLIYGTLTYFFFLQVAGFVGGLLSPDMSAFTVAAAVGSILTSCGVLPALGVWCGVRADNFAYGLPPLIGVTGQAFGVFLSFLVLGQSENDEWDIFLTGGAVAGALLLGLLCGLVLGVPAVAVGRHYRLPQYAAWAMRRSGDDGRAQILTAAASATTLRRQEDSWA